MYDISVRIKWWLSFFPQGLSPQGICFEDFIRSRKSCGSVSWVIVQGDCCWTGYSFIPCVFVMVTRAIMRVGVLLVLDRILVLSLLDSGWQFVGSLSWSSLSSPWNIMFVFVGNVGQIPPSSWRLLYIWWVSLHFVRFSPWSVVWIPPPWLLMTSSHIGIVILPYLIHHSVGCNIFGGVRGPELAVVLVGWGASFLIQNNNSFLLYREYIFDILIIYSVQKVIFVMPSFQSCLELSVLGAWS